MQTALLVAIFMAAALAVVFLGHYFIYVSAMHFFRIAGAGARGALMAFLIILPLTFIAASLLAHWKENYFTKGFYLVSGLWLGVAVNLILAFAAGWILFIFFKLAGVAVDFRILASILVFLSLLYSGYGVWAAFNPKITRISVRIPNLPAAWRGKTVVQLSDVHLGHVLGQQFLQKVVGDANALKPGAVFITGDLFDGMDGNLDFSVQPLDQIQAPGGVFFVTGNHETYFGVQRVMDILRKTKVKVLDDQTMNVDGLQIVGISYPERGLHKDLGAAIKKAGLDPALPSVLLWHSPSQIPAAKAAGVGLMLAGHAHKGQIFPCEFFTWLIYGKYDYGLHAEGNFTEYTSSGTGVWGPTMRTKAAPEIVAITLE